MSYSLMGTNPFQGGVEHEAIAALTPLLRYWNVYPATDPRRSIIYHVDCRIGDDSYDGLSWDSPVATIAQAITLNNATVDWTKVAKHNNWILIRPGVYPESLDAAPYYCHMIGLGGPFGLEKVQIHPAQGSVFTGNPNMLGTHLANLVFQVDEAVPIFDLNVANNDLIEDCLFTVGAEVVPTAGIDTQNCSHLMLRRNRFLSGQADDYGIGIGINHNAGFAHACWYYDNIIAAMTAGIYLGGPDASTFIQHNTIVPHALTTLLATGIHDVNGHSWLIDNFIIATDCINHAGGNNFLIANREIEAGAAQIEFAGTT